MKKSIQIFTIIGLYLLISCSYETSFYIFNKSSSEVLIEYQSHNSTSEDPFTTNPRIVEFDNKMSIIEIKKAYNYQFDSLTNTIECKLKNNQALWIGKYRNFTLSNKEESKILQENLKYLKISSTDKEYKFTPVNIIEAFESLNVNCVGILIEQCIPTTNTTL